MNNEPLEKDPNEIRAHAIGAPVAFGVCAMIGVLFWAGVITGGKFATSDSPPSDAAPHERNDNCLVKTVGFFGRYCLTN
jgi:hypothetical protein